MKYGKPLEADIHINVYNFLDKLEVFRNAAIELSKAWERLETEECISITSGGEYPFHESFDEMTVRIIHWQNDIREKMKEFVFINNRKR